jgi:hypothetical protein
MYSNGFLIVLIQKFQNELKRAGPKNLENQTGRTGQGQAEKISYEPGRARKSRPVDISTSDTLLYFKIVLLVFWC